MDEGQRDRSDSASPPQAPGAGPGDPSTPQSQSPRLDAIFRDTEPLGDVADPIPASNPYNPAKHREWVRGLLASALLVILAAQVLVPMWAIVSNTATYDEMEPLLTLTFGTIAGLVGSALGFYYGSERRR